jgi:ketosteroid isomerase-like protein
MPENDNVAVIKKVYEAFNRADIATLLANVAPDAEWVNYGPSSVPYAGDFTGRMMDFFQAIGSSTDGGAVKVVRAVASGDVVITEARYTAKVRGSGAAIDAPIAHFFTFRDGKIVSWRGYSDSALVAAAHAAKNAPA